MTDVVVTKRCPTCGQVKTFADFGRNRARHDGLNSQCRSCTNRRVAAWAAEHPAAARARGLRWKERHPDGDREKQRRYRAAHPEIVSERWQDERAMHPERYRARKAVHHAVASGALVVPGVCQVCGCDGVRLHAHHPDYSRPLEVAWVCPRCHKRIHPGGD